jgi:hypothetical protein
MSSRAQPRPPESLAHSLTPPPGRSIMTSPETTDVHDGDFSLHCTQNIHLSALVFGAQENVSNPNPGKVNVESWQWMVELDPNRQQTSLARACQTWLIKEAR